MRALGLLGGMHRVADAIEAESGLPLLHIADATGAAIRTAGLVRIGLLGTRFTMEQPFYAERLRERYGLDVLVPETDERETIHRVIYDELVHGRVVAASRDAYRAIIARLVARGAQGVIYGCTEIGLLVGPEDASVATFDTTAIHARAAAEWALAPQVGRPREPRTSRRAVAADVRYTSFRIAGTQWRSTSSSNPLPSGWISLSHQPS
jgi:aspartate racemase